MITSLSKEEYKKEIVERGKKLVRRLEIPEDEEEKKGLVTKASLRNMMEFACTSSSFEEFKLKSLYLVARSLERGGESDDIKVFLRNLISNIKEMYAKYSSLKSELEITKDLIEAATMAFYARSQYLDRDLYG